MKRRFQNFASRSISRGLRIVAGVPFVGRAIIRAGFDAVRQNFGDRSWLFGSLQDAWVEIDKFSRAELQRLHGELIWNAAVIQKIRSLFLQFSVGPSGLICTPNASRWNGASNTKAEKDQIENWNNARAESWERWWRHPQLNDEISGAQLTRVWSGLLFDKGEVFVNLTYEDLEGAKPGVRTRMPKVQTIDAHRCCTPDNKTEHNGNAIVDGVEMTKGGKVVAYWIKKTNFDYIVSGLHGSETEFERVDAYDKQGRRKILHKFKVRRPGQVRGVPEGFSVYNLVRDNLDLHKLEMQCAKLASEIGLVETNPSGELDVQGSRRARLDQSTVGGSGASVVRPGYADYNVSVGGKRIGMKSGDKLENFMISRPTVATQAYWDLHYTLICIGYNIPKLLVMPYSIQGTVTRLDSDICSFGFGREHFELIKELLTEVYEWQTAWAIDYDRSLDGKAPDDCYSVVIRPPRAPNVDIGYSAKAVETEVKLGIRTIPDIYAEKQMDWRQKTREAAEYIKFVNEMAKEYGVEAGQITSLAITTVEPEPDKDPEKKEEEITV